MRRQWTSTQWLALLLGSAAACGACVLQAETSRSANELRAALEAQPRVARGERLFRQCAACHGRDAGGSSDGTTPALAGQHFRYLAKQIVEFRDEERFVGPVHDQVARDLVGAQAIADLAAFLAGLSPNPRPKTGPGRNTARGEVLYADACQSCHGDAALGNDELGIPSLRNQHCPYLLQQIRDIGQAHRFNAPPDLILLLKDMPPEDAAAIADYLSRLGEALVVTDAVSPTCCATDAQDTFVASDVR